MDANAQVDTLHTSLMMLSHTATNSRSRCWNQSANSNFNFLSFSRGRGSGSGSGPGPGRVRVPLYGNLSRIEKVKTILAQQYQRE
jgi:hypothetical protein